MIIEIDGISIEITKKPIKNMSLRIYPPDGLVKVSAPLKYSERLIRHHLEEKKQWIHAQRERIRTSSQYEEESFQTGSTLPFQGKNYLLIIDEHNGPTHIKINEELIHCYIPPNTSLLKIKALFERWYRQEMERVVPDLIKHWEAIIKVQVAQWGIKKMKTRWGSCNTRAHRIWLNLNLIKKPIECLEYVLVHELVHLLEASHNARFYGLMTQFMPEWRHYQFLLEGKHSRK
jgi:predicted metal-dependent hydrolase